ncbi:hypothetical protein P389DRAFT_109686 [Cystobasidium minutum MCA 4210]|uniref:uncharacterized protein n=1 Tax=Cystobasidium minutum MCA 4210 TaxID=1397322 RepID=UPI0034CEF40E|eukprot:jgi/Rhomi1/109686/CE109685_295
MAKVYTTILQACIFAALLANAEPIACPGNDVNICNAAFASMGPTSGVESAACIQDKCVATCQTGFIQVNRGERCGTALGAARGLAEEVPCPNNDVHICNNAFAPGYFSSGVAAVKCENNVCIVTCRSLWESVDGHYCKRGATVNICKDFETAEVLDDKQPECKCWGDILGTPPDTTCGCDEGKKFMTTTQFQAPFKKDDDGIERGQCF